MMNPDVDLVVKEGGQVVACCRAPMEPKVGQHDPDGHWRCYEILRSEGATENPGSTTVWVKRLREGGPSDNPVIWRMWRPKH